MGKKKGGRGSQHARKNRSGAPANTKTSAWEDRDGAGYTIDKTNEKFEAYYKEQRILPDDEWEAMLASFREPLPTTFRLTGSRATAHDLNDTIKSTYIPHLSNVVWEGNAVPAPVQIPWYPEGLAWQLNVRKSVVRKSPEFKKFQDFLVYETDVGNISRQEAVSMIPPLVLDVKPHHAVLDMCAAPGSKTAQLLEALHTFPSSTPTPDSDVPQYLEPTGVVIANDSDFRRAYMLVHQSARLHSTALMVTNLDASAFPSIRLPPTSSHHAASLSGQDKLSKKKGRTLLFDRILCDVPCSGDGTLRKNPQIWKSWVPQNGNGLHPLQVRILVRAMGMLAPGGRIVFSTCSLNPSENEAVLAAALNALKGQFHLMDVSSSLSGLIRRPGLTRWRVAVDKDMTFFDNAEAFQASLTTEKEKKERGSKVPSTLFPPDNVEELHLERSMRIYPHHQDTGGFFVAVLERVGQPSSEASAVPRLITVQATLKRTASNLSEATPAFGSEIKKQKVDSNSTGDNDADADADGDTELLDTVSSTLAELDKASVAAVAASADTEEAKTAVPPGSWKEAPYNFLPEDNRHLKSLLSALHINATSFPSDRTFIRTSELDNPKSVYVCNPLVRDIIVANEPSRIRLINCGVRAFTRQQNHEKDPDGKEANDEVEGEEVEEIEASPKEKELVFRFVYEGVEAVLPHVEPMKILQADLSDLRKMLETYYPYSDAFNSPFGEQIKTADKGTHLVRIKAGKTESGNLARDFTVPLWVSPVSVSLMGDKQIKSALCLRLFGEDFTPFGKTLLAKKQAKAATATAQVDQTNPEAGATTVVNGQDPDLTMGTTQ